MLLLQMAASGGARNMRASGRHPTTTGGSFCTACGPCQTPVTCLPHFSCRRQTAAFLGRACGWSAESCPPRPPSGGRSCCSMRAAGLARSVLKPMSGSAAKPITGQQPDLMQLVGMPGLPTAAPHGQHDCWPSACSHAAVVVIQYSTS